jgi:glycosyltransferase involved in cell wall biosynthesis
MSSRPILSVVVPVFREASHLSGSLTTIWEHAAAIGVAFEIVVVDDGSTDGTWGDIERLAIRMPELHGVSLTRNFGKEAAILAGLESARGEAVVVMDGDLQHPPEMIPKMVEAWRDGGYEVVNGRKRRRGRESRPQAFAARLFYRLFERLAHLPLTGASDFKLLDRRVVEAYCALHERNTFFRGLIPWLGFRQTDVFFDVGERPAGRSNWPLMKRFCLAADAIISFSALPLQFVTVAGLLFLAFAVVLAGHTVYVTVSGNGAEGFPTIILLTLTIGSILMLSLGLIGIASRRRANSTRASKASRTGSNTRRGRARPARAVNRERNRHERRLRLSGLVFRRRGQRDRSGPVQNHGGLRARPSRAGDDRLCVESLDLGGADPLWQRHRALDKSAADRASERRLSRHGAGLRTRAPGGRGSVRRNARRSVLHRHSFDRTRHLALERSAMIRDPRRHGHGLERYISISPIVSSSV